MTPEHRMTGQDILPESAQIAERLLEIQEAVNAGSRLHEAALLRQLCSDLKLETGYTNNPGLVDTRIAQKIAVVTPRAVAAVLPVSPESEQTTVMSRERVQAGIAGQSDRLTVVAGPCSIHDPAAALEYASGLSELRSKYNADLEVVMRAYTEKPRTELGWKGFTYDPYLDNSNKLSVGLIAIRMLMGRITHLGLPVATEPLNALTPQYLNGLVTYSGIGARNVTDQTSRERASGFSTVVGFKNSPEGSIQAAVDAVVAARAPHDFLGVSETGMTMQVSTKGNLTSHVILRGAQNGPNYSAAHVSEAKQLLAKRGLPSALVIDASHGNSQKDHKRQIEVVADISMQIASGEAAIRGVMIESFLVEGRQNHDVHNPGELKYGQSITDACVDLETTAGMLDMLARAVQDRRRKAER
ncbi:MAG TPA: 3-deoxy-7-phosphoheptulonate synthase [Candidatus Limnocylindrales bacterium]|nr:3-deoxy-7-phosphoheptulonate synthase [Candidatus Limnocylindrales bacterium]